MTQQVNLPSGMVEAAAEAFYRHGTVEDGAKAAIKAALEWAVKEGWAGPAFAYRSGTDGCWDANTGYLRPGKSAFPVLILRLEEPKP